MLLEMITSPCWGICHWSLMQWWAGYLVTLPPGHIIQCYNTTAAWEHFLLQRKIAQHRWITARISDTPHSAGLKHRCCSTTQQERQLRVANHTSSSPQAVHRSYFHPNPMLLALLLLRNSHLISSVIKPYNILQRLLEGPRYLHISFSTVSLPGWRLDTIPSSSHQFIGQHSLEKRTFKAVSGLSKNIREPDLMNHV